MKRILGLIISLGIGISFLLSCSSPTTVAEKALKLAGRGIFVPTAIDKYMGNEKLATVGLFTDYDNVFNSAFIHNDEAEFFLKNGFFKETPRRSYFYFSDIMFSKYQLIKKKESSYDIRMIMDFSKFDGLTDSALRSLKDSCKHLHDEYKENGSISTWLVGKSIPAFIMRYNLDNKYIAEITVLKLPDDGYRVCSFIVE